MRPALLVPPADAANGQRHEMAPLQRVGRVTPVLSLSKGLRLTRPTRLRP